MSATADKLLAGMRKQFGEAAKISMAADLQGTRTFRSSGSLSLDLALGNGGWPTNRVVEICGPEHVGKALAMTTPLPTPHGWTTMEKVHEGDVLFDEKGLPTRVLGVYDVPRPESVYDVEFSDGSVIRACGEHLWATWTQNQRDYFRKTDKSGEMPEDWAARAKVLSTDQIKQTLSRSAGVRRANNHCVFLPLPLQLPEADLLVDPWVLGYWIGNGTASSGGMTCHVDDEAHVREMLAQRGFEVCQGRHVKGRAVTFTVAGLKVALRELGVLNNKHIPAAYLRSSEPQRLALAQGLMDSDGHQSKQRGGVEFSAKGRELVEQVSELLISLSEKPTTHAKVAHIGEVSYGTHYRITFTPSRQFFTMPRRAAAFVPPEGAQGLRRRHRTIVAVRGVPSEPMRCIMVDSPNSLYLAGTAMIPTHNTSLALLTMRTFLQNTDRYGVLLDCEHKSDAEWVAQLLGEEFMERLFIVQPLHIEQATDMYVSFVGGNEKEGIPPGQVCCAILDSIGGAASMQSVNKSAEIGTMGGNAQGVGRFARVAASYSNVHECLTIGINQVRDHFSLPNAINRPGGHAWKHAIVQAVQLSKAAGRVTEKVYGEDVLVGQEVKGRVLKNGCAPPHRIAKWWFFNVPTDSRGVGIDTFEEIERLSILTDVVTRAGAWYKHQALPGGQVKGRDQLKAALSADDALWSTIVSETRARLAEVADQVAPMGAPVEEDGPAVAVGLDALAERHG